MRGFLLAGLCLLGLALLPFSARAELFSGAAPVLRIVYTADSLGYLHPCPTCGGFATGGLARRASLLTEFAAEKIPTLILAGPGEFYADRQRADAAETHALASVQAKSFAAMPYSAIYMSAPAAAWLQKNKAPLPASAIMARRTPVTRVIAPGGRPIGIVFFPAASGPEGAPLPEQVDAVLGAARDLAAGNDLVVGVSPWGMKRENALMRRFAGSFHVILGAGEGLGIPGQAMPPGEAQGPLWARAESMGRAITIIDILAMPGKNGAFQWTEGITFSSREIPLSSAIIEDPMVRDLMRSVPRDIE